MTFLNLLRIIRVHIVAGGALAFSLGLLLAVVAGGTFSLTKATLFYSVAFFGDLSTHYSNDYFDVEVDKLAKKKKHFSGSNILVSNPHLRSKARLIAVILLALSIGLAAFAVLLRNAPPELLAITLVADFLGWAYSAPPFRLVSRGLGETAISVAVGFAIPAVGYLSAMGKLDAFFAYFALPFLMYGLILSLSLQAPDREIDLNSGKANFSVRTSEFAALAAIFALATLSSTAFLFLYLFSPVAGFDFLPILLFSLVPLATATAGAVLRKNVRLASELNIVSLFVFNLFMTAYLLALAALH